MLCANCSSKPLDRKSIRERGLDWYLAYHTAVRVGVMASETTSPRKRSGNRDRIWGREQGSVCPNRLALLEKH